MFFGEGCCLIWFNGGVRGCLVALFCSFVGGRRPVRPVNACAAVCNECVPIARMSPDVDFTLARVVGRMLSCV